MPAIINQLTSCILTLGGTGSHSTKAITRGGRWLLRSCATLTKADCEMGTAIEAARFTTIPRRKGGTSFPSRIFFVHIKLVHLDVFNNVMSHGDT